MSGTDEQVARGGDRRPARHDLPARPRRGSRPRLAALAAAGVLLASTGCSVVDQAPISQTIPATGPAGENLAPSADTTFIAECTSDSRIRRPTTYILACADGGELLENLVWNEWGESRATATGTLVINDCTPTCATGRDISVPARVVADELITGTDVAVYRRLMVTSTGEGGSGQANQQVYHLPGIDPSDGAAATLPPLEDPQPTGGSGTN